MEETAWRRANFDDATGLPNHSLLYDRLEQGLAVATRDRHTLSLLFIGVQGRAGAHDHVLRHLAERLVRCVRESDTVAHLGRLEFVVLLPGLGQCRDAERVAHKLLNAIAEPFPAAEEPVNLNGAVGAACFPGDGETAAELLRHADAAMFEARTTGTLYARFRHGTDPS